MKIFKNSEPYVNNELIKLITKKIKNKEFSKFIGSPEPSINKFLFKESKLLKKIKLNRSFFGGKSVRNFEYLWSKKFNFKFSISVNSATSGITAAIMALNIRPGDEIITTPFTFSASSAAILAANAIPVFADIDLNTYCLDPTEVEKKITKRTKAILAVHWNSNCGDLKKIKKIAKKHSLYLIEDASQCHGMKYENDFIGNIGDISIFSFNEPKNIMTGEGGMIVTNNKLFAAKCRLIRNHGENVVSDKMSDSFIENIIGYNFRLPEILAEIGVFQLKKLSFLNSIRKKNYNLLIKKLKKYRNSLIPQKITNTTYYPYTVAFRWIDKDIKKIELIKEFKKKNIPISTGLSRLICDHPIFNRKKAYKFFYRTIYGQDYIFEKKSLKNAKTLNDQYIGFFQIGWPTNEKTILEIIKCFESIAFKK